MTNISPTSDAIAPKELILPERRSAVSGALFISGALLLRYDGNAYKTITET